MKRTTAVLFGILGAVLSSAVAMAVPVSGPLTAPTSIVRVNDDEGGAPTSHFTAGGTLLVDARLGHASLPTRGSGETYLFASVTGAESAAAKAPPLDLAIVIDRSGS